MRRQASPKVLWGAAGALLAIGAIVAIVIVVAGGSDPKPPAPLSGAAQVDSLLSGITQSGNRLGSPAAPVTMVEYVDLQCPICRDFEENYFPEIVNRYVRSGKVQVESRPLAFVGLPDSQNGQFGAIAAGDQGRMFHLMQILYRNQGPENSGWLSENMVESAAVSFGLDLDRFRAAFDSADTKSVADSYVSQSQSDAVSGTPTVLVGKTGGALKAVPYTSVDAEIDRLLK